MTNRDRDMKVLQPTAWFMIHRIREARDTDNRSFLRGPVEVDETYIGGKEGPQAHRKVPIDELCDPERTLHMDSKVLAVASEEPVAEIGGGENGDDANNGPPHMPASNGPTCCGVKWIPWAGRGRKASGYGT